MAAFQEYFIYFLIWLIATMFIRVMIRRKSGSRLPPSPLALPIIGHLHLVAPIPHQALHKLSVRYGSLIHLVLGSVPCVVVSSPEMAKEFLKTHETSFSDRPRNSAVDYLTYGSQDFSFAPYGLYWKFMKKLCMSELLCGKTLDVLNPVRRDEIRHFVEFLSVAAKEGKEIDVGSELMRFSNNVISRMIMSRRCTDEQKEAGDIQRLVKDIAELAGMFNVSDYIWFCKNLDLQGIKKRLKDVRIRFDDMLDKIIKDHQEARNKRKENDGGGEEMKDLLHVLLDVSEDENAEVRLSSENIKAFILVCFSNLLICELEGNCPKENILL
ncbi:oxygenase [Lithospermum erythrorhizon]|uniref:Oxygenase n=1 Tax=Lithospermum erythrorhizon TaxID=34254 RepID=A0AAV3RA60_LITER